MAPAATRNSPPPKSPEVISGMFNRIADTYDLLNDCMTGGMHRAWKLKACRALQLQPGDSVLDVCTGTGDLAAMLSGIVGSTGRVTGLDFSKDMLAVARTRHAASNAITWVEGDALNLPFEDNTFNGAIISFGLRNVASVEKALAEMVRVVKPGGRVINLDTASDCRNPLFWFYFSTIMPLLGKLLARDEQAYSYLCRSTETFESPAEIDRIMGQSGLKNVEIQYLGLRSVALIIGQKS